MVTFTGPLRTSFAALLTLALAACGGGSGAGPDGGGGGGGTGGGGLPADKSISLAAETEFTDADFIHFLQRTHWGGTPEELQNVRDNGIEAVVDAMLVFPAGQSQVEMDAFQRLIDFDDNGVVEDPAGFEGKFPSDDDIREWWLHIMQHTTTPFQEVVAMFWHDHFAINSNIYSNDELHWMVDHVNLLRASGTSNFRTMLYNVSVDPAMLDWLDGIRSRDGNINENFSREFWELFTLGEGNGYTQMDIEEAARSFTGFRERTMDLGGDRELDIIVYEGDDRHDGEDKTIFGQTVTGIPGDAGLAEYDAIIDLTMNNRPVAEFIVTKLWEHFCFESPSTEVVNGLAQIFRDSNYELAPVLRTMFLSEAFYSDRAKEGLVKSPVDYGIGFVRQTGLRIELNRMDDELADAGQRPTGPPNVAGWESGVQWLGAQNTIERANMIEECVDSRQNFQNNEGIDVADLLPSPTATGSEVVDALIARLRLDVAAPQRDLMVTYMDSDDADDEPEPFDPTNANMVNEKVRGLLYILSQHPTYHVR